MRAKGQPLALGLSLLLFLFFTSAIPVSNIVWTSLANDPSVWVSILTGRPSKSLPEWSPALSNTLLWFPLTRSLYVGLLTTLFSTALGTVLAWLTAMTDVKFRRWIAYCQVLQLVLPPMALSAFWIVLGNRLGFPAEISHGPLPMVLVLSTHFQSLVFLMVNGALSRMDQSLLDAARVHGGWEKVVHLRVVLPLVAPSIAASAALVMFFSVSAFAPLFLLGTGSQPYYTLSMQVFSLYMALGGSEVVMQVASVLVVMLVLVSVMPFAAYFILVNKPSMFAFEGGFEAERRLVYLGSSRNAVSILAFGFLFTMVAAPLSFLLMQSISGGAGFMDIPPRLSAEAILSALGNNAIAASMVNTLLLGVIVASLGVTISLAVSYAILRLRIKPIKALIYGFATLPSLFPGVAMGLAYLTTTTSKTLLFGTAFSLQALYGTLFLVILVNVVVNLTFGIQVSTSALAQIDESLEEAARASGATLRIVLRRIVAPIAQRSLFYAWIMIFVFAVKEVDTLMFLYAPLSGSQISSLDNIIYAPPVGYLIFRLLSSPGDDLQYAQGSFLLALLSIVVLVVILAVAHRRRVNLTTPFTGLWSR